MPDPELEEVWPRLDALLQQIADGVEDLAHMPVGICIAKNDGTVELYRKCYHREGVHEVQYLWPPPEPAA